MDRCLKSYLIVLRTTPLRKVGAPFRPWGRGLSHKWARRTQHEKSNKDVVCFFSSPSLLHPSCGLFVCQASSAHPPPRAPAPPQHPACETKKRTKRQKKSRQKLNLIPYQKKPSLEKSKIFNLENDKEVLAFLGVRAVCVHFSS